MEDDIKVPLQRVMHAHHGTCVYTWHDILNACTKLSRCRLMLPWLKGKWKLTWRCITWQNMCFDQMDYHHIYQSRDHNNSGNH